MFGDNDYYYEKSYCLEHPYFWIYRENGQYTYRIFDVMRVTDARKLMILSLRRMMTLKRT